jgi:DNA-binding response OmpR family regulator
VLVVEDDEALADVIARGLRQEALAVDVATDGMEALHKAEFTTYDVVVLDRDLPVVHGDEVCERLTGQGAGERILMLTAAGTLDDRVAGLALGADDYLAKPFAMKELVARVRALGRRVPAVSRRRPAGDEARRHRARRAAAQGHTR